MGDFSVNLSNINHAAFTEVQRMYNEQEPLIQQDFEKLGSFSAKLNQRLSEAQRGKVRVISDQQEKELQTEEVSTLSMYWGLHGSMVKANELMRNLQAVRCLLNQPVREPLQQSRLNTFHPDIHETVMQVDHKAKGFFDILNKYYDHIESINGKMEKLMGTTSWEMMKFSKIVEQKGEPLSKLQLAWYYTGTPVVRSLTAAELASMRVAATSGTSAASPFEVPSVEPAVLPGSSGASSSAPDVLAAVFTEESPLPLPDGLDRVDAVASFPAPGTVAEQTA